jgi:RES domain-containing protein
VTKRRRLRPKPPAPRKVLDPAAPPSLYELDSFSLADIERWRKSSDRFDELHRELYFGLEIQRVARREELLSALRSKATRPIDLSGWHRLVEYQYCLEPLAAHGSVTRYGGRFNVGIDVGSGAFGSFPALYLAEDLETAFREYHQVGVSAGAGGLTREDFALTRPGSFLSTEVHGHLELVFDMGDVAALRPSADLIASFKMPPRVAAGCRDCSRAQDCKCWIDSHQRSAPTCRPGKELARMACAIRCAGQFPGAGSDAVRRGLRSGSLPVREEWTALCRSVSNKSKALVVIHCAQRPISSRRFSAPHGCHICSGLRITQAFRAQVSARRRLSNMENTQGRVASSNPMLRLSRLGRPRSNSARSRNSVASRSSFRSSTRHEASESSDERKCRPWRNGSSGRRHDFLKPRTCPNLSGRP